MTHERKGQLLEFLGLEIKRVKEVARKADEASKFILTGPSQSGDRYHSENAAELAKSYLKRLEKLVEEVKSAKEEILKLAQPVCFVEIEYEDKGRLSFVLVENALTTPGQVFISKNSPLGTAVLGKGEQESFSYELTDATDKKVFSGKVVKVE